jgi:hypothetical protein
MANQSFFHSGQTVMIREMLDGKVWSAQPVSIVQDKPDLLALYMADGSISKMPVKVNGGRVKASDRLASRWLLKDRDWNQSSYLRLNIPGSIYSVLVFWKAADRSFQRWYINLEDPLRRTSRGFEFLDQWLDVIIEPDLSSWHWKDEDEFQEAIELGLISSERAVVLRTEGERMANWIQSGKSPFNGWEKWRPDPSWKIPVLPADWDRI